jgi:curved DNA-binding protein CbpA
MEYKQKDKIPNLYQILGLTIDVCKEPNCNELIKKAYIKKAKLCHPDKHSGRKDMEELFELITSAYDILRDEKQRMEYNRKLFLLKPKFNDFFDLKKGSNEYMRTLGKHESPISKQDFNEMMKTLDAKHGFDSSRMNDPISLHDTSKKLHELTKMRTEQDIELKPEKIFDSDTFDLKKFNAAFDLVHKNEDAIIPYNDIPSAWNDNRTMNSYCTFDNLDNIYADDDDSDNLLYQTFSNAKMESYPKAKITEGADYVDGHRILDKRYYQDIKLKLHERNLDSKKFEKMKYSDFSRDDFAGYGIFDKLGIEDKDILFIDNEDKISRRYEKIMAKKQDQMLPDFIPEKAEKKTIYSE